LAASDPVTLNVISPSAPFFSEGEQQKKTKSIDPKNGIVLFICSGFCHTKVRKFHSLEKLFLRKNQVEQLNKAIDFYLKK